MGAQCVDGMCTYVDAYCGNGVLDEALGEACDDGNSLGGDGCNSDCTKIERCGDGSRDEGEGCDDENDNPNDACDACKLVTWTPTIAFGPAPRT